MDKLLVIEDNLPVCETIRLIFRGRFDISIASYKEDLLDLLSKEMIDFVIIGLDEPLKEKLRVIEYLLLKRRIPGIILLSNKRIIADLKESLGGANYEIILKPFDVYEIQNKVEKILGQKNLIPDFSFGSKAFPFLGNNQEKGSSYLSYLWDEGNIKTISLALRGNFPILLMGERGSGFLPIAMEIFQNYENTGKKFVWLCSDGLSATQFIDTLTQAGKSSRRPEVFLYLEEIEKLKIDIQLILMELLTTNSIFNTAQENGLAYVNLRLVASGSEDLRERVEKGDLRQDLYYRMILFPIFIRALRERRERIPDMVDSLVHHLNLRIGNIRRTFSPSAKEALKNYHWPGNLDEFETVVIRTCLYAEGEIVEASDILWDWLVKRDKVIDKPIVLAEEKREMEEKGACIKADDLSGDLIKELAHEIKNPMVSIKAFTQLLPEKFEDEEFKGSFYNMVSDNVDRIDHLVEGMINFSQFLQPTLSCLDIAKFIDTITSDLEPQLKAKKIGVLRKLEDNLYPVLSDPTQLSFVLKNILSYLISLSSQEEVETIYIFVSLKDLLPWEETEFLRHNFPLKKGIDIKIYSCRGGTISRERAPEMDSSPYTPAIIGLDLLLAQRLVNKNLGIMEVKRSGVNKKMVHIIDIKLPAEDKFEEQARRRHEKIADS